jgi:hypothetical protein
MKPSRVLPFACLLAATSVFGQELIQQYQPPNPAVNYNHRPADTVQSNCPVGMTVDRNGLFAKREVKGTPDSNSGPSLEQRIQLNLTNRKASTITGAQVTVHGLSQKARFMEVSNPKPDMAKAIQLSLDLKGNGQSANVLWLNRFAVVTAVDLNSVTYADGSTWREPSPAACSVQPSLLVRVGLELQR